MRIQRDDVLAFRYLLGGFFEKAEKRFPRSLSAPSVPEVLEGQQPSSFRSLRLSKGEKGE
jgi:hypothetical protein